MTEAQVTSVVEEYLETIYKLQDGETGAAKTNDIVRKMKVVPGTVTNTIERLEKEGYLRHEPYRGVKLTEKGRRIAVQVVRRHRLSERLLTDILHVNWGKAHDVACKIEHDIADEEIMDSIEKALGNPKTCPHGNPILAEEDRISRKAEDSRGSGLLADLNISEKGRIIRVTEEDAETLKDLLNLGLVPGALVEVKNNKPSGESMTVIVNGSDARTVDKKVASTILVEKESGREEKGLPMPKTAGKPKVTVPFGDYEH